MIQCGLIQSPSSLRLENSTPVEATTSIHSVFSKSVVILLNGADNPFGLCWVIVQNRGKEFPPSQQPPFRVRQNCRSAEPNHT